MKEYNVAVFVNSVENSKRRLPYEVLAYLRDYNSEWPGFNNVKTFAKNGKEAEKRAIRIIKTQLAIQPTMVNISRR